MYIRLILIGTLGKYINIIIWTFLTEPFMTATSKIILEKQKTVTEGIRVFKIPCIAEGIPFPTVTWEAIDVSYWYQTFSVFSLI